MGTSPHTPADGDEASPYGLPPPTVVSEFEVLGGAASCLAGSRHDSGFNDLLGLLLRSRNRVGEVVCLLQGGGCSLASGLVRLFIRCT